jgi:phage baseplate assembly protein W|tara:strand:- start:86 stop:532 length:447 start_codon:yes stop_codon:yes gene_type:complete
MSTQEKDVIKTVKVQTAKRQKPPVQSRAYRGISTVDPNANGFNLYDLALIKQDIINLFHIRQGEKLENPEFGTIVWDALYEPLTEDLKEAIAENVTEIVNYDPRVTVNNVTIDQYESGLQISVSLTYLPYNISESLLLTFDQNAGFIS